VHQLVPELIEEMKDARRVLFIDAAHDVADGWTSTLVEPRRSPAALGHHETPANLLALLILLEGRAPEATLVTISAPCLDHGEQTSAAAAQNMQAALGWIRRWLVLLGQEGGAE
jgi:Ni,Fe-hydrogenase maturation factor